MPRSVGIDSRRIVVADPDDSVYAMVRQLTAPDRWRIVYAPTPGELVSVFRKGPISLALVALSLVDGLPELAEEISARTRRGLNVVITAEEHSESTERRARLLGPVFYAPKPLEMTLLNHVLEGALGAAV